MMPQYYFQNPPLCQLCLTQAGVRLLQASENCPLYLDSSGFTLGMTSTVIP